uniref:Cytochrome P450 n=1 Tax=Ditylenchus dipsaci TaxID=166011 RepID=A0A915EMM0_9BILA
MEKLVSFVPVVSTPRLMVHSNRSWGECYSASNRTSELLSSTSLPTSKHDCFNHIRLLLFACLIGWLIWTLLKKFAVHHTSYWYRLGVPSPKPEPFVGHLDQLPVISQPFDMSRTLAHFAKWSRENGRVYGLQLGWLNLLMVGDGDVLHDLFVDKVDCFHKIQILATGDNPTTSFFRMASKIKFYFSSFSQVLPVFCESSVHLVKLLEQQIGHETINLQPYMQVLAWQVLSRIALGERSKSMSEQELSACSQLAKQLIEGDRRRELPFNGNEWMNLLDRYSLMVPWLKPLFSSISKWLWMDKQHQKKRVFSQICDHFNNQYGQVPKENIQDDSKNIELKDLFLLDILPVVGSESTSNALSEICYNLAKNPLAQKLLQDEIDGVVDGDEMPTYEQLGRLKFANAVIKESLRLNPAGIHSGCSTYPISTFLNTRICIKKTRLGNVEVEPGVIIQPDLHAINYDKTVWGDNVEEFCPQRTCLGQKLVILEAKTALVYLCRKFNFIATIATEKKLKLLMDGNSRELTSVYPRV